ncbi:MAG: hypothetical protein ACQETH_16430 [Candidatus Rifleibacteriota bacterium]
MSIGKLIISDEVPLDDDGFHWRPKGHKGTIYYIERGKLLTVTAEVFHDPEKCDIVVYGSKKNLEKWDYPDKKPLTSQEIEKVHRQLLKWLKARHWDYRMAED